MKNVFVVERYRIIGTSILIFAAWEPSAAMGRHTTITTFDQIDGSRFFGKIGTDPDGSKFAHLPVGPARSAAVREAYAERYALAHDLIVKAFPEAASGKKDGSDIELIDETRTITDARVLIEI